MRIYYLIIALAFGSLMVSPLYANESAQSLMKRAYAYQQRGDYQESVEHLRQALQIAENPTQQHRITALLGDALLKMHKFDEAEKLLAEAGKDGTDFERAQIAIDIGNIKSRRGQHKAAREQYKKAIALASGSPELEWIAQLDLAILEKPKERLVALQQLYSKMAQIKDSRLRARIAASLGAQAHDIGKDGDTLAHQSFEVARKLALELNDDRVFVKSLDGLGQLYEEQHNTVYAISLTENAIEVAQREGYLDLLVSVQARLGRLLRANGKPDEARAMFGRAIDNIQAIRPSILVEYRNGRSTFRDTLEPIYLEYSDLLLEKGEASAGIERQGYFRQAQDALESIKRGEIDDYLGDRCTPAGKSSVKIDAGVAVLYPVIFKDRVDLLVETSVGMYRKSTSISSEVLRENIARFAFMMSDGSPLENMDRKLYDVLMLPIEPILRDQHIDTLVVVPDGPLRLIPFGALHDGKDYIVEKYAIAVMPGLSFFNISKPAVQDKISTLLVGMSELGGVVDKVKPIMHGVKSPEQRTEQSRSLRRFVNVRNLSVSIPDKKDEPADDKENAQLRSSLALPGVKDEIESLGNIVNGNTSLLNGSFTVNGFREKLASGSYRRIHIATHGFFGGSAEDSFIMAYDDLIYLNDFKTLLSLESLDETSIDLLTFSACQTAQGNDRAPLGFAGAALKARAQSALGTLWPVADTAAMSLMKIFYQGLNQPDLSKVKALQQAQQAIKKNPEFDHPFYWAPFTLVGNWK